MSPSGSLLRLSLVLATLTTPMAAQIEFPAPSPHGVVEQRVGITDLTIDYSRPSMKGREIFGGLVPYGDVWRTGANAPTKLTLSTAATVGGHSLEAGTYALFTIPGEDEWTIILSDQTEIWGSMGYDQSKDVARFSVPSESLAKPVESFTVGVDALRDESAEIYLAWDTTRVAIPLTVDTVGPVLAQLSEVMAGDGEKKPWHQAAAFYLEHDQDLSQALEWAEAAVDANPNAYWSMHLKARILAELGRKDAAKETAKASRDLAEKSGNPDYVRLNEKLIAEL